MVKCKLVKKFGDVDEIGKDLKLFKCSKYYSLKSGKHEKARYFKSGYKTERGVLSAVNSYIRRR